MEGKGRSRKDMDGGGLLNYSVSPSLFPLDFRFWIWDLDLGLDLGLTISKSYFLTWDRPERQKNKHSCPQPPKRFNQNFQSKSRFGHWLFSLFLSWLRFPHSTLVFWPCLLMFTLACPQYSVWCDCDEKLPVIETRCLTSLKLFWVRIITCLVKLFYLCSNRYGRWHKDKADQTRNVRYDCHLIINMAPHPDWRDLSRVIVFVLGGATYSEARVGYEVSNDKTPSWEVIVGKSRVFRIP